MRERFQTNANVILTFEDKDDEGSTQEIYNAYVNVGYPANDADKSRFEVDVIKDVLVPSRREHDNLVKISLCYDASPLNDLTGEEAGNFQAALTFLARHQAKYYFQPNQREEHEERLVEALGIGRQTCDL